MLSKGVVGAAGAASGERQRHSRRRGGLERLSLSVSLLFCVLDYFDLLKHTRRTSMV